jgi:YfiH family protein
MRYGGVSPKPWSSLNMATSVGDSRESVIENRRRIAKCLSFQEDSIFDVWQVHSNRVIHAMDSRNLDQPHQKADAIITNKPNVTIMMLFADCVPVMMYDPKNNVASLVHAGWQGTVNEVVGETVKSMKEKYGCKPEDLVACIGPSICVDHYIIGKDVAEKVERSFENTEQILIKKDGKTHLDLQIANRIILQKHGIKNIQNSNICTACNTSDWYSHRAEKGKTGRFAAVITAFQSI